MVCSHVLQGREPPPHRWGVSGASAKRQTWEISEGTSVGIIYSLPPWNRDDLSTKNCWGPVPMTLFVPTLLECDRIS